MKFEPLSQELYERGEVARAKMIVAEQQESDPNSYNVVRADVERISKAVDPAGAGFVRVGVAGTMVAAGYDWETASSTGQFVDVEITVASMGRALRTPEVTPPPTLPELRTLAGGALVDFPGATGSRFSISPEIRAGELKTAVWVENANATGPVKFATPMLNNNAVAVGKGFDVQQGEVTVIATQDPQLAAAIEPFLQSDEILLPTAGRNPHPDILVTEYLLSRGITLAEIGASPQICFGCQDTIHEKAPNYCLINPAVASKRK